MSISPFPSYRPSTLPTRTPWRPRLSPRTGASRLPRRTALIATGLALALLGSGGLVLWGLQRAAGGFFTTAAATLTTSTSALVTDEVLVEERRPGNSSVDVGDLAQVRIRATHPSSHPLFLGIGPKDQVEAYLRNVSHDRMTRYDSNPFAVRYTRTPGGTASPPSDQPFWVATASGTGPQTLLWNKKGGAWSAVAMNANGSSGIQIRSDIGLRFGFLLPVGAALSIVAVLVLLSARRTRPAATGGTRRPPAQP